MWNTFPFEAILYKFIACQKLVSTHAPLFFGKSCMPKNNLYHVCSKDDVNTPSAMHILRVIIIYRPCFALRAIIIYRPFAYSGFLPHTWVVFLQILAIESSRQQRSLYGLHQIRVSGNYSCNLERTFPAWGPLPELSIF